jgi:AcrR family transcriptional regulator
VFAHFETQEALISAVIEEFGEKIALRTHELATNCAGVREVLSAHLTGIMEVEEFYTRLVIESRMLPKVSRETFVMIQSAISLHLSQAAQREMEAGTIAPMPVALLFNTWVGLIHYYLINGDLFAPEGQVLKRYGQSLLDHYMSLLQPKRLDH